MDIEFFQECLQPSIEYLKHMSEMHEFPKGHELMGEWWRESERQLLFAVFSQKMDKLCELLCCEFQTPNAGSVEEVCRLIAQITKLYEGWKLLHI